MTHVAGADVAKGRWVVVTLRKGEFEGAAVIETLDGFLESNPNLEFLAVDIPIGMPKGKGHRQCDIAAKRLLKPKSFSVFFTPPRRVLAAPTYEAANDLSKRKYDRGLSTQAYALRTKILEVEPIAAGDGRIIEAHPEVCFQAMKEGPLQHGKKSWNGQVERRELLRRSGIRLPSHIERAGTVPPDDILDAAAAAWTAWRVANGKAEVLPNSAAGCPTTRRQVIWC